VANINALSAFFTRFDNADGGVQGAAEIQRIFNAYKGARTDVTVQLYNHPNWRQPSVIATVEGTESDEIVAVSAHEDSIGRCRNAGCRAPGADDDASGICAMLEAFRVLMAPDANNNFFRPKRTLMFFAFAAEETGLRGSTDIVNRLFLGGDVNLMGILQSEMNGYQVERQMTLIRDQHTSIPLTEFTSKLINEYVNDGSQPNYRINYASCGSCSDHVPFTRAGYRAACMAEDGPFGWVNPHMHTEADTIDKLNVEQMAQFAKLGAAFAVEMSMA